MNEIPDNSATLATLNKLALLALIAAYGSPVFAGDSGAADAVAAPGAVPGAPDSGVEEVVVTARKRAESAIDVPLGISVFGAQALEQRDIKGIADLESSVPSLYFQERGLLETYASIRGVGGDPRNVSLEAGVGVNIDDVSSGRSNAYDMDLVQIEQVEVLRGPQGTLFGTNTIGGIVNVTTAKPSATAKFSAKLDVGNYDNVKTAVSASGPVTDTLFLGGSFGTWNSQGYIYDPITNKYYEGQHRIGGRVQLRCVPTDALEIYVTADATRDRRNEMLSQLIPPYTGFAASVVGAGRFTSFENSPNFDDRDMHGIAATVNYNFGPGFTLKSISSTRQVDTTLASDGDSGPQDLQHSGPFTDDSRFYSQELRLISPSADRFRYVAGLYGQREVARSIRYLYINNSLTNGLNSAAQVATTTYAAFGNFDYDIAKDLTLSGGLRHNTEDKTGYLFQNEPAHPTLSFSFPHLSRSDVAWSWTGSLTYKVTSDMAAYSTVSRGNKSGGFNVDVLGNPNSTPDNIKYLPEYVTNYELGLKGNYFSGRLRLNADVFHLDYSNRQVSTYIGTTVPVVTISNAAKSVTNGVELDGTWLLPRNWTASATFSYLHARYTAFPNATAAGASYSGHVTEFTPAYTSSIGVDRQLAYRNGAFTIHGDAQFNGKTYFDAANNPQNVQNGYWLLNSRFGYEFANQFGIFAYGRNLANRSYLFFARQAVGVNQGLYGPPRTYGIQLSYKY